MEYLIPTILQGAIDETRVYHTKASIRAGRAGALATCEVSTGGTCITLTVFGPAV